MINILEFLIIVGCLAAILRYLMRMDVHLMKLRDGLESIKDSQYHTNKELFKVNKMSRHLADNIFDLEVSLKNLHFLNIQIVKVTEQLQKMHEDKDTSKKRSIMVGVL